MAETGSLSSAAGIVETFTKKLTTEWKRKAVPGRTYVHTSALTAWMLRQDTAEPRTNAARLLYAVYKNHHRVQFQYMTSSVISQEPNRCLLVFAALLELGHGDLIDIFQNSQILDHFLSFPEHNYVELKHRLRHAGVRNVDEIIRNFDKKRWEYCPASIQLNMHGIFHGGNWILPFCKREPINEKGGTAELWQVLIQEDLIPSDLRDAIRGSKLKDKEFGVCYQMALKSYSASNSDIFEWEKTAYIGINGQEGMVQYLGEYICDEEPGDRESRTHNILLEYGELDLDEFFADPLHYPPILTTEIVGFWTALFKVADALQRIHNLTYTNADGVTEKYYGWHADLKPDNILRVHGEFKLADFGFAKFKKRAPDRQPMEFIEGGTETYGSPECDPARRKMTKTAVSQTIDTWSFGCVLSIAATWVALGFQGVLQYVELRKRAISELKRQRSNGEEVHTPTADDAFHDGRKVLPHVSDWHSYLRTVIRKSDTMTHRVLNLVDEKMLLADPNSRLNSKELWRELRERLILAQMQYKEEIQPIPLTVAKALLYVDEEAASNAEEVAAGKRKAKVDQQVAQNEINSHIASGPMTSLAPPDQYRAKSKRIKKSERLNVIPLAKVAHRAKVLGAELKDDTERYEADQGVFVSANMAELNGFPSTICESPTDVEPPTFPVSPIDGGSLPQSQIVSSMQSTQNQAASMFQSHTKPLIQLHGPAQNGGSLPNAHVISAPAELDSEGAQNYGQSGQSQTFPGSSASQKQNQTSPISLSKAPPAVELPSNSKLPATPPTRSVVADHDTERDLPKSPATLEPAAPTALHPSLDICQVRRKLERTQSTSLTSIFSGSKPDEYLKKFINERDIKFVVDNGTTMLPHWPIASFVLETLTMKLAGLDDDGLDLVFTLGRKYNIDNAKGGNARKQFRKAMDRARAADVTTEDRREKTDMGATLGDIFQGYLRRSSKKMTLIILTDGVWEGSIKEKSVENKIADFVRQLLKIRGSMEERRFSIEFISFGNNQKALNRLLKLDDELESEFKIPDIIDTEPWYGKVNKMILGSIRDDMDEVKSGPASPTSLSPTSHQHPLIASTTPPPFTRTSTNQSSSGGTRDRLSRFLGNKS